MPEPLTREYQMTMLTIPWLGDNREELITEHLESEAMLGWRLVTAQPYRRGWLGGREYHFFWMAKPVEDA
jgi:hypothetical protein